MNTHGTHQNLLALALSVTLLFALALLATQPVQAAPLMTIRTVTNSSDSGAGSLRDAISVAGDGDTINFNGNFTIRLASELAISKNLTIDGSGYTITLSGDTDGNGIGNTRVLNIYAVATVTLNQISIVLGKSATTGGAIYSSGALTVKGSTFSVNSAASGGGIYRNSGALNVLNSTFSQNSASSQGGAIYANGGDALNITNVTFSGNSAASGGGGIYAGTGAFTVVARNTILANSATGGNCSGGTIINGGNNIDDAATCGFFTNNASKSTTNPLLSSLGNFGGFTKTFALLPGSPALNAGNDTNCGTYLNPLVDQRGVSRLANGVCDIGAYESQGFSLVIIQGDGQSAGINSLFALSLQVALSELNGNPLPGAVITYTAPASGASAAWSGSSSTTAVTNSLGIASAPALTAVNALGSYTVTASANGGTPSVSFGLTNLCGNTITVTNANDSGTGSLRQAMVNLCPGGTINFGANYVVRLASRLTIDKNMTIDGTGRVVTINGDTDFNGIGDTSLFINNTGINATLKTLILTKGKTSAAGGIWNNGTLAVSNSTISDNSGSDGGGIYNTDTLNVNNSTFKGNIASGNGGGIYNFNTGTLNVSNSTFSANSAATSGGGIFNDSALTLKNNTFSGNSATSGGGIYNSSTAYAYNTILANNATGGNCFGTIINGGNNIDDAATCGFFTNNASKSNTNPLLSSLGSYGGPTQTYALLAGSPAIDTGNGTTCAAAPVSNLDQRSVVRPQGTVCDIGAYELKKFAISGNVSTSSAGLAGVVLSYTDGVAKTATTDASGNYSFIVSDGWTGTVTPAKAGYVFSPLSRSYTNVTANQLNQNYLAIPLYTISGNAGIAGATLSYLDGTLKTVTADGSGNYSLQIPSGWYGVVTPSKTGYSFTPASRTYSNVTGSLTGQNYTVSPVTFIISGTAGVAGAVLSYTDGSSKTATADASGNYSFTVSYNWSGTVTPSHVGYTFTPANRSYVNVQSDQLGQNYVATPITFTISGSAGIASALLWYNDGGTKTATADASGNYSFAVSYNWTGTVTPSKAAYIFTPASRSYANVLSNLSGQNYTAAFTTITFSISGNAGVAGAALSYDDGGPQSALADGSGNYSFVVPYNWSGTVTPVLAGYIFIPANRVYLPVLSNQTAQNYIAHAITVQTFKSDGVYDGWVRESSETSGIGSQINSTNTTFVIGDDALNRQFRAILSFDTSVIPDNAVFTTVVLRIKQYRTPIGTDPFTILGSLRASIRTGTFGTILMESSDFQATASLTAAGNFNSSPVNSWYSDALNLGGRSRINKLGITQFRLAFTTDDNNNFTADYMRFLSGDVSTSKPQLVVTYYLGP